MRFVLNTKIITMFKILLRLGGILLACMFTMSAWGQRQYRDGRALERSIQALEQQYGDFFKASQLTQTSGGSPIWQLTLGKGDTDSRPALVIVGGVAGPHLLGQELAMGVAENLLAGSAADSVKQFLDDVTVYVFPQMSPDAAAQYFSEIKFERQGNGRETDNDRDGYTNEDVHDDLDSNGILTQMRIAATDGKWVMHPADSRIMRKATPEDAMNSRYHVFPEGLDNDRDGLFNEDGEGGIHFNKNWTFNHPTFSDGAGDFGISELETRALADFLFERFNVFAVLTFGPSENLVAPYVYRSAHDRQRVISGILSSDADVNKMISGLYGDFVETPKGVASSSQDGGFMEWAYFHYGRFSFGTPGWYVPEWQMPKDSAEAAIFKTNTDKNADVNLLRWAESQEVERAFVPWDTVVHPDFPGQAVEVGGLAPFLAWNPPYAQVRSLKDQHTQFAFALGQKRAKVAISQFRQEQVGDQLWRIKAKVVNTGKMPTASAIGDQFNWVKRLRVDIELSQGQVLSTGRPVYLFSAMDSGESQELSWLIRGNGTTTIKAGAPHLGYDSITINLQ